MRKHYAPFIVSVLMLALPMSGCLFQKENIRPSIVERAPQPPAKQAPGSIWRGENDKNLLFADKKARYVNDIVTIIVSETAAGANKGSTTTKRDSSADAAVSSFLGVENSILNANTNMGGKIAIGGSSSNSLKGTGDTSRNNSLIARISARVIRVLDNGNLLIEGRRQVTVNAEDQYLIISGIIRPEDITRDNTVASQYIADAQIVYTGEGVINDKMRPGWLTRVVDWVWPF